MGITAAFIRASWTKLFVVAELGVEERDEQGHDQDEKDDRVLEGTGGAGAGAEGSSGPGRRDRGEDGRERHIGSEVVTRLFHAFDALMGIFSIDHTQNDRFHSK